MERVWRNKDFRFFGYDAKLRGYPVSKRKRSNRPQGCAYLPAIVLGPCPWGILLDPFVGTEGMTLLSRI